MDDDSVTIDSYIVTLDADIRFLNGYIGGLNGGRVILETDIGCLEDNMVSYHSYLGCIDSCFVSLERGRLVWVAGGHYKCLVTWVVIANDDPLNGCYRGCYCKCRPVETRHHEERSEEVICTV